MPKFVTIGYGDKDGHDPTEARVLDAAHAQDKTLRAEGALIGIAGAAVQVRNPGGAGVVTADGPYSTSTLPVAGFAIIEAEDLADAIRKVATVPCAVTYGVVEVWPLTEAV